MIERKKVRGALLLADVEVVVDGLNDHHCDVFYGRIRVQRERGRIGGKIIHVLQESP